MGYGNSCHSNTYGRKKRCKSRDKDGTIQQFTSDFRQGDYNSGGWEMRLSCSSKSGSCSANSPSCTNKSGSCANKSKSCANKSGSCEENLTPCPAGQEKGTFLLKNRNIMREMPPSRAYIYGISFPKKAFTPSHEACFLLILNNLGCEGLKNKAFTRVNGWLFLILVDRYIWKFLFPVYCFLRELTVSRNGWLNFLWRVGKASLHTGKYMKTMEKAAKYAPLDCEGLKCKAFTLVTTENQEEKPFMWRLECFFEDKKTYRKVEPMGQWGNLQCIILLLSGKL